MEPVGKRGWTDTEKTALFIQIATLSGKIPWDQLKLPEGRTMKACQVMFDKEKQKVKKAMEAEKRFGDGSEEDNTKQTQVAKDNKKRKNGQNGDDAGGATTKKGAGRKKVKAEAIEEYF